MKTGIYVAENFKISHPVTMGFLYQEGDDFYESGNTKLLGMFPIARELNQSGDRSFKINRFDHGTSLKLLIGSHPMMIYSLKFVGIDEGYLFDFEETEKVNLKELRQDLLAILG